MYSAPHASNLLLWVDRKHDPTIKKILDAITLKIQSSELSQTHVFDLTGPNIVARNGAKKMDDLYKCQDHQADSYWYWNDPK